MSRFVIELSDSKTTSVFLEFIKTLSFVKKVDAVSVSELDNRILRLGKSIRKINISEKEILKEIKSVRRKRTA